MAIFVSVAEAVSNIKDNSILGISGFGGWLGADLVFSEVRRQFFEFSSPKNLTVFGGILPGNLTDDEIGLNLLAVPGLISRVIAAHVGMPSRLGKLISENRVEAFALPLGVVTNLLQAAAGNKPGVITKVGIGTFVDPRLEGGALNDVAKSSGYNINSLMSVTDNEYLFYHVVRPDVCILRASTADHEGNISVMKDPFTSEQLEMAMTVKASGGKVIVQVDEKIERTLLPKEILIHKSLVDCIVVDIAHTCTPGYDCPVYRPELIGEGSGLTKPTQESMLNARKICGRRGALELKHGDIVNLGVGIPDSVAAVAYEEGISSEFLLSVESGPLGGVPVGGVAFGASENPEAIYRLSDNFNFYDGGGLDIAFLGAGEIDEKGNVNVSRFGTKSTGPGGFINIVQNTPTVCFLCTFTAGGLQETIENGKLFIIREGKAKKFRKRVQQVTFSGEYALRKGQNVLYITERAVFRLDSKGLSLIEIAPGVDLEKDILGNMEFSPYISPDLKEMDSRIFEEARMNIKTIRKK